MERDYPPRIQTLSAVTLLTRDMRRAVHFYCGLGFQVESGGADSRFTTFRLDNGYLNLIHDEPSTRIAHWGRIIFHVSDVDAVYRIAIDAGHGPEAPPRDAEWGERFFHLVDPDGHELSFAKPLATPQPGA